MFCPFINGECRTDCAFCFTVVTEYTKNNQITEKTSYVCALVEQAAVNVDSSAKQNVMEKEKSRFIK